MINVPDWVLWLYPVYAIVTFYLFWKLGEWLMGRYEDYMYRRRWNYFDKHKGPVTSGSPYIAAPKEHRRDG